MDRRAITDLLTWKSERNRKPLVIRGARQVGKTWLVRRLAELEFDHLLEVNFDRNPEKADLVSNDVEATLRYLSADSGVKVEEQRTLVFFDEVQAAPHVLQALRYFYEERPNLHVIAAGSLLDFVLEQHDFSMPVGRVSYYHLGPLTFEEFLEAHGEEGLAGFLRECPLGAVPESMHRNLLRWVREFADVGGMPAVVSSSVDGGDPRLEQQDLLQTYRDDFGKYLNRVDVALLRRIFDRLPKEIGRKVKFVNFDRGTRSTVVADHIHQFVLARLVYPVYSTSGNGIPLDAEVNEKAFKLLHLDVGLLNAQLGRPVVPHRSAEDVVWVNEGQLAEQFVGQHLLHRRSGRFPPALHYWLREAKSSNAEVDYLVADGACVLPVEVKAGATGSLKSLHVFCGTRSTSKAVRFYTGQPTSAPVAASIAVPGVDQHEFELLSLPLYLIEQLDRLLTP